MCRNTIGCVVDGDVCVMREMCGSAAEMIGCSEVFMGIGWWNEDDKNGRVCYPDILWRC